MDQNDRMARAEDYVFGLMDEKARARAERDMETDTEFRNCVMTVAERLRRLHLARGAAPDPDQAWREIGARIAAMPQMVAAGTAAAGAGGKLSGVKEPVMHQFGGLRGGIVAACLIVAMGIGYVAGRAAAPLPPAAAIAILDGEDGAASVLVELTGTGAVRVVPLAALTVPEGKVPQLWARPGDDGPATALGALARATETTFDASDLPPPGSGLLFVITLENAPGATGGAAQGPVLASGTARPTPR